MLIKCKILYFTCARIYRHSFRENNPKTIVFNDWKRPFWASFRENWAYKFGHCRLNTFIKTHSIDRSFPQSKYFYLMQWSHISVEWSLVMKNTRSYWYAHGNLCIWIWSFICEMILCIRNFWTCCYNGAHCTIIFFYDKSLFSDLSFACGMIFHLSREVLYMEYLHVWTEIFTSVILSYDPFHVAMITNQEHDLQYLWNNGDPGPEPAQAQLGDVNAVDGDWTAGCLDNPYHW